MKAVHFNFWPVLLIVLPSIGGWWCYCSWRPNRGHALFSTSPSPFIISAFLWFHWCQCKETPFIIVGLDTRALESQVGLSPQAPSSSLRERQETACLESDMCVLICTVFRRAKFLVQPCVLRFHLSPGHNLKEIVLSSFTHPHGCPIPIFIRFAFLFTLTRP